jgi:hypothetical protein
MGVPLPFHGEVSRARWELQWLSAGTAVELRCPARLPLIPTRRMRLDPDRPVLYLQETVTNESELAVPFIWGHHPAFGPPLAAAGARIDLPAGRLVADAAFDGQAVDLVPGSEHTWPYATDRNGQAVDLSIIPAAPKQRLVYAAELKQGWFALRNPQLGQGVAMAWERKTFPHLWFWQELASDRRFPFYGRAHIVALEPAAQWPAHGLAAAHETGTAHQLAGGQTWTTELTCVLFTATQAPVTDLSIQGDITSAT